MNNIWDEGLISAWNPLCFAWQKIDQEVRKELDEAVGKARTDAELPLNHLYLDIYSQIPENFQVRGCDSFSVAPAQ